MNRFKYGEGKGQREEWRGMPSEFALGVRGKVVFLGGKGRGGWF
jgi:hypothetical protein